jgi:acetylornithine deacetylase/succinyl-diaminopimelate desuccinylase-like protein
MIEHKSEIKKYIVDHQESFLNDLKDWLRIPSISGLPEHRDDMYKAANYAADMLRRVGLEQVEIAETQGHPLVYAEWLHAPEKPTMLIYGHYDVQPADPIELWETPPFEPTIRNNNLYSRGVSDDKGQMVVVIKALETLMQIDGKLPLNVKVLIEGEEEIGSPSLGTYVKEHYERLACDTAFICDSPMEREGIPTIITGLRGILYTEVDVRGARRDLHSGIFGGIAPNPLHALAIILSKLKDEHHHINIPGLYDKLRQPSSIDRDFWDNDPLNLVAGLQQEMGVKQLSGEAEYPPLERLGGRPTLDVHGIVGGFVDGGAKTVIPGQVTAKISMRLPPDLQTSEVFTLFEQAVKAYAPSDVEVTVRYIASGEGLLVSQDSSSIAAAATALKETFENDPIFIRSGGTLPIAIMFQELLNAPVVLTGFSLPDDNLHAPNEKYSLDQFYKGIYTVVRFLEERAIVAD